MKISHRIHARKVALAYIHRQMFLGHTTRNQTVMQQIVTIGNTIERNKLTDAEQAKKLAQAIEETTGVDPMDVVDYLVQHCFQNRGREEIDMEFLFAIVKSAEKYRDEIAQKVNEHTTSFGFEQMDTVDQSLFLLGYTEHKICGTPKEVILNEMVEISKRYGDDGSTKLINGILHHILSEETAKNKAA